MSEAARTGADAPTIEDIRAEAERRYAYDVAHHAKVQRAVQLSDELLFQHTGRRYTSREAAAAGLAASLVLVVDDWVRSEWLRSRDVVG